MKLLTPGTPAIADLDRALGNTEERGPFAAFCAIRDNFTQTSEHFITTTQTYLTNSPGAPVKFIFNG